MLEPTSFTGPADTDSPNLVTVVRELPADLETPVSVYLKLAGEAPSFLLESVTGGEQVARYSYIGINPSEAFVLENGQLQHHCSQGLKSLALPADIDPLAVLRGQLARFRPPPVTGLPRFMGGLVGYLGYEMVGHFESRLNLQPHRTIPEAVFLLCDSVIVFDHAFGRLILMVSTRVRGGERGARAEAEEQLDRFQAQLSGSIPGQTTQSASTIEGDLRPNISAAEFCTAVDRAKRYIAAGDIFQVVLSQRLSRRTGASPFSIYRALRRLNPSPYMFFFDFKYLAGSPPMNLIGASPEMHVRLEGRRATMRPIAGTRPRGANAEADAALEKELLADPKERAEHVMLVDLARNDLGRVCRYGSVQVPVRMAVERYSHVMHIVSQVEGDLKREYDAFDLMRATFPAGTVSGAPKIRAMEIISELEREARGPYAGAVGFFSFDGSLDSCITIRTLVMLGQEASVQAGGGIVADSVPEREYQESCDKAKALAVALEMAEKGI
jgi:anthranilate synthase component 1